MLARATPRLWARCVLREPVSRFATRVDRAPGPDGRAGLLLGPVASRTFLALRVQADRWYVERLRGPSVDILEEAPLPASDLRPVALEARFADGRVSLLVDGWAVAELEVPVEARAGLTAQHAAALFRDLRWE